jgi:cytochrome c peroxidase|nr:hypothetical protein [Kofleriaceae bacterium]
MSKRVGWVVIALAACRFGGNGANPADSSAPAGQDATPGVDAVAGRDASPVAPDAAPAPPAGYPDPTGYGNTVFGSGAGSDLTGPFFASLGTNGRTCGTCHDVASGWSITPRLIQQRFAASGGGDPLFRLVDGAVSPIADVSTPQAARAAYAMLLDKGVLRIGLPIPANAEFTLVAVDDPYGYASASELSLFRRPLPSTNLRFESVVMWDGREPSLAQQAVDATLGHAQASAAPGSDDVAAIVAFESGLTTAQSSDDVAGDLASDGAGGGPVALAALAFQPGATSPQTFALYDAWQGPPGPPGGGGPGGGAQTAAQRQASIARGQQIFDTRPIHIAGVAGIADQQGACATCHDTPGVGDHDSALLLDLGLTTAQIRTPDLPLYTLQRTSDGTTVQTTDPGAALVTGAWADVSRFKVPTLRGLATRAPYFHDAFAPTLDDVVNFYNARFRLGLSPQEHADLVAFLSAL